jgi:acetyltransferase-like isoleucine patch superfamily enzyme
MPKTNIGKGSLVGAYSYVKGDYPDFAIITGNPGRVVGDTRKMDERLLIQYPELKTSYDAWAKN